MHKLLSMVAVIGLAACGGGNKPAATATTPAPETATAPASGIELAELKFYEGDDLGMQLHADGHLQVKVSHSEQGKPAEEKWMDVGVIGADGSVSDAEGKKHGTIGADGSFKSPEGQTAPFHVEGETLVVGDKKITIDDKGILQGGNDMGKPMRIEGATTPGLKRTALVLLAILMASPEPETPSTEVPPAPPSGTGN
jgi:hypothetical protein